MADKAESRKQKIISGREYRAGNRKQSRGLGREHRAVDQVGERIVIVFREGVQLICGTSANKGRLPQCLRSLNSLS